MPRRSVRFGRAGVGLLLPLVACLGLVAVACDGGDDDEPLPAGGALAERWLRAAEENNAAVAVYERALPPHLTDLLNPNRTVDTPTEDLVAFPVHPEGDLLGSYVLRRADGANILWLFYDIPESNMGEVMETVSTQLDAGTWQVLSESGSRSNRLVSFENASNPDITGDAIAERTPDTEAFDLVVDRDGEEVSLEVARAAPVPLVEASFSDDLTVQNVFPGFARTAGLQEGDRVVRVGETAVGSPEDLQGAVEAMAADPSTISLLYLVQFAPPSQVQVPPFAPADGLALPSDFPMRDAWAELDLAQFEAGREASGAYYFASLFSEDTPTVVAEQVREALGAAGWEIVTDEAAGFGTNLEFAHEDEELIGVASINESETDESLTQVFVQIQSAPPGG